MRVKVTNTSKARQGVYTADEGVVWIEPGSSRKVYPKDQPALERSTFLSVEVVDSEVPAMPERLAAKVADPLDHDGNGRKGGSPKGAASTRSRGARRRKAAKK